MRVRERMGEMGDDVDPTKYITKEELANHNKPGDLWISIQGKIYDVSDWAHIHPGGSTPLLTLAGQEVTDAFLAFHPRSAWSHLPRLSTGFRLLNHSVSALSTDYRRLHHELSRAGLFERKDHIALVTLLVLVVLLLGSVWLVLFTVSPWAHLLAGGMMGVLWIQSGWLGHDSGHYQMMSTRGANRLAQVLTGNCLTGISIAWWKWNHNAHHLACNSLDYDPDLQHIPFFAVSSRLFASLTSVFYGRKLEFSAASRFLVSYQHLTFYPVMCLARINLFAQSVILLLGPRRVPYRWAEIAGVLTFWAWYPLLVSCLPSWWERAAFVAVSFSVTGIQHVQFCLNHFSSDVYVGAPTANEWFEKQTKGSLDIECSSWMDWFHGGLQFQVEHHLFPRLPRCNLRQVAPLVRELCKKHNLPYNCASFLEANAMTLRTLRSAALEARDLANPNPRNLLWEAVNTHG